MFSSGWHETFSWYLALHPVCGGLHHPGSGRLERLQMLNPCQEWVTGELIAWAVEGVQKCNRGNQLFESSIAKRRSNCRGAEVNKDRYVCDWVTWIQSHGCQRTQERNLTCGLHPPTKLLVYIELCFLYHFCRIRCFINFTYFGLCYKIQKKLFRYL